MDTFDRDQARALGAEAEEHGVVVLAEGVEAADLGAGADRDSQRPDLVELLVEQVGRQAVGRNAVAQHAAGLLLLLEDLDLVTERTQVVGGGETGWTGADDPDPLAGVRRDLGLRVAAVGEAVLGRLGLHRPDEHGAVAAAANARRFARRGADQATGQRQRVIAPHDLDRRPIVAMTDVSDEARDVDVGRTRAVTGRGLVLEAQPLRAGLAPGVTLPLLAVVAQRAAQRPCGRQPLRAQLERDFVERAEMRGVTAAERQLGHQPPGAGEQGAHRIAFGVVGELPMPVERAARLAQKARALGHHHQRGRHRHDAGGRRATAVGTTRRPRTAAGSRPGRRRRRAPGPRLAPQRHHPSRRSAPAGSVNGQARPGRAA